MLSRAAALISGLVLVVMMLAAGGASYAAPIDSSNTTDGGTSASPDPSAGSSAAGDSSGSGNPSDSSSSGDQSSGGSVNTSDSAGQDADGQDAGTAGGQDAGTAGGQDAGTAADQDAAAVSAQGDAVSDSAVSDNAVAPTTPTLQPAAPSPNVAPAPVQPDVAYTTGQGGRVEVYSSAGNNDLSADWRQVNEYAYLISSVPACANIYSTVYNSYWDHNSAAIDPTSGKWQIYSSTGAVKTTGIFSPTVAFRDQLNSYPTTCSGTTTTAKDKVHILGNKLTFNAALDAGSSLADLLHKAGVVKLCSHGEGACLSTTTSEELMHAKYALLQQAKDSEGKTWSNVIWITSANLNGASGGNKSNLSIAIFGDANGYNGLLNSVWNAEVTETFTAAYKAAMANGIKGSNTDFTFYPSPRSSTASQAPVDFEADYLASQTNAKLGGTKSSCKAYVVQSLFSTARTRILDGLAALQKDKCSVNLLLGDTSLNNVVDAYFSLSTSARQLINRVEFGNVHDKTMTLSYTLNGKQTGVTWGGSENFNGTSLRYDELAFRANNLTMTRAVEQQSERLYLLTKSGDTVVPVTGVTVTPNPSQIQTGKTLALKARVTPSNATVSNVTWQSGNTAVATVSSSGVVTGVAQGTATITATSMSGTKVGTTTLTVVGTSGTSTPPDTSADPPLAVTSPPLLTAPLYQNPSGSSKFVVTWAQGQTDLSGKVSLQYYSGSSWKSYKTITISGGRGTGTYHLTGSRTWRAKALSVSSPSKASLKSSATYSKGLGYTVVRTKGASSTMRIYAPGMVRIGTTTPFLISWKNPYASKKYKSIVKLQYYTGKKWVTSDTFTFNGSNTQIMASANVSKTRKWRAVSDSKSMPKGKAAKKSSSITVKAT